MGEQVAARSKKKKTGKSVKHKHRHWKVSYVGNIVEPEEI